MNSEKNREYIAIDDLWDMSPQGRLIYLKTQWDLIDDCVYGQIKKWNETEFRKAFYTLQSVKNINGVSLEYPLSTNDFLKINKNITKFGIYIGRQCVLLPGSFAKASIENSPMHECKNSYNPLSSALITKSLEPLRVVPNAFIANDGHGNALIQESLETHLLRMKAPTLVERMQRHEDKILKIKELSEFQNAELLKTEIRLGDQKDVLKQFDNKISEIAEKEKQLKKAIDEEKKEFHRVKNECDREKKKEIEHLESVKEEARLQMTQLKEYVQSKADFLRDLKLISKDQFDYVTGNMQQKAIDDETRLDFTDDLNGDFEKLTSQIQSYLYSKHKYYTKSVLGNFLTLLRTNDLIIISGASGTGKSYLVNAFAQAIGGVAKIVPVKPNWTSSEDLLGYYNPMQKSYMTTPFLDAIVAAKRDPEHLHLICLDEMNLARVEYYFADFLSVLEEREKTPIIHLYSSEEAEHIRSEFQTIIGIFDEARSGFLDTNFSNFGDFLHHKEIAQKLQETFGGNKNSSLVDLYGRVRRMVSGVLNIPAEFEFPDNVRIIGTINIDQTTHYFAPKVLDRAYLLKFESPLVNISLVEEEVGEFDGDPSPIYLPPGNVWSNRKPYPRYDPSNVITNKIEEWNKEFLTPMGIEVGMRVMRQTLLFQRLYEDLQSGRTDQLLNSDILNIILLMKIFPHFMFDGDLSGIKNNSEVKKHELVKQFAAEINKTISQTIERYESSNASTEIQRMIQSAEHHDKVYNYWT